MAMNKNRKWHLFTAKPVRFENKWLVCEGEGEAYPVDKNFPKAENWKESCYKLVKEG
jgi:hypothetical protein